MHYNRNEMEMNEYQTGMTWTDIRDEKVEAGLVENEMLIQIV